MKNRPTIVFPSTSRFAKKTAPAVGSEKQPAHVPVKPMAPRDREAEDLAAELTKTLGAAAPGADEEYGEVFAIADRLHKGLDSEALFMANRTPLEVIRSDAEAGMAGKPTKLRPRSARYLLGEIEKKITESRRLKAQQP